MQLHAPEPLFKIFYTFFCENVFSCRLKFPRKIADKYMENLKQASEEFKHRYGPKNLLVESFAVQLQFTIHIFYRTAVFGNYSTLDCHTMLKDCNFSRACLLVNGYGLVQTPRTFHVPDLILSRNKFDFGATLAQHLIQTAHCASSDTNATSDSDGAPCVESNLTLSCRNKLKLPYQVD